MRERERERERIWRHSPTVSTVSASAATARDGAGSDHIDCANQSATIK